MPDPTSDVVPREIYGVGGHRAVRDGGGWFALSGRLITPVFRRADAPPAVGSVPPLRSAASTRSRSASPSSVSRRSVLDMTRPTGRRPGGVGRRSREARRRHHGPLAHAVRARSRAWAWRTGRRQRVGTAAVGCSELRRVAGGREQQAAATSVARRPNACSAAVEASPECTPFAVGRTRRRVAVARAARGGRCLGRVGDLKSTASARRRLDRAGPQPSITDGSA